MHALTSHGLVASLLWLRPWVYNLRAACVIACPVSQAALLEPRGKLVCVNASPPSLFPPSHIFIVVCDIPGRRARNKHMYECVYWSRSHAKTGWSALCVICMRRPLIITHVMLCLKFRPTTDFVCVRFHICWASSRVSTPKKHEKSSEPLPCNKHVFGSCGISKGLPNHHTCRCCWLVSTHCRGNQP